MIVLDDHTINSINLSALSILIATTVFDFDNTKALALSVLIGFGYYHHKNDMIHYQSKVVTYNDDRPKILPSSYLNKVYLPAPASSSSKLDMKSIVTQFAHVNPKNSIGFQIRLFMSIHIL